MNKKLILWILFIILIIPITYAEEYGREKIGTVEILENTSEYEPSILIKEKNNIEERVIENMGETDSSNLGYYIIGIIVLLSILNFVIKRRKETSKKENPNE